MQLTPFIFNKKKFKVIANNFRSSRRGQTAQQFGFALSEPGKIFGGRKILPTRAGHLRDETRSRRSERREDEEQLGLGLPQAGEVQGGGNFIQTGQQYKGEVLVPAFSNRF